MTKNFKAFLKLNEKKFKGKYVVFIRGKLFKAGENIEKIIKEVRSKFPKDMPFVAKVPAEEAMILWLP